jgi:hypothetical protein
MAIYHDISATTKQCCISQNDIHFATIPCLIMSRSPGGCDTMLHHGNNANATHHQQTQKVAHNESRDTPVRISWTISVGEHELSWQRWTTCRPSWSSDPNISRFNAKWKVHNIRKISSKRTIMEHPSLRFSLDFWGAWLSNGVQQKKISPQFGASLIHTILQIPKFPLMLLRSPPILIVIYYIHVHPTCFWSTSPILVGKGWPLC